MEKVVMGTTALPDEIIIEYLESIKSIYLPEAYDLFMVILIPLLLSRIQVLKCR